LFFCHVHIVELFIIIFADDARGVIIRRLWDWLNLMGFFAASASGIRGIGVLVGRVLPAAIPVMGMGFVVFTVGVVRVIW
jgi:hypothetical protein